jgi:hypothetical protein
LEAVMLRTLLIAVIVVLATWGLLVVAAKRLPPGILKDLAGFLPACLTTVRRLRNNPQVRDPLARLPWAHPPVVAGRWLPVNRGEEFAVSAARSTPRRGTRRQSRGRYDDRDAGGR